MARILVIDDDRALRRTLSIALSARGHEVAVAENGGAGLAQTALTTPDVIVLDLKLPDLDGVDVCRRIRQQTSVPVIVLSVASNELTKVAALDAGADDYVTKPFGMSELEARLRAALRRGPHDRQESPTVIDVGRIQIDLARHMARLDGSVLDLTDREFSLLGYLARNVGKICTQQMILHDVWGSAYCSEAQYLRVYAYRLRRKLGNASCLLRTQPGIGYRLVDE